MLLVSLLFMIDVMIVLNIVFLSDLLVLWKVFINLVEIFSFFWDMSSLEVM